MKRARRLSNVMGVDDGPFDKGKRGDAPLVGAVYASERLDGFVTGRVRRDGRNATEQIHRLLVESRFDGHVQCLMLSGITFGGFNVVDLPELADRVQRPVLVVARKAPSMRRIEAVLKESVPGGDRKWALIQRAGPMERCGPVFVQRAGLTPAQAETLIERLTTHGKLPEPLRVAHLMAGALVQGHSRGGA